MEGSFSTDIFNIREDRLLYYKHGKQEKANDRAFGESFRAKPEYATDQPNDEARVCYCSNINIGMLVLL